MRKGRVMGPTIVESIHAVNDKKPTAHLTLFFASLLRSLFLMPAFSLRRCCRQRRLRAALALGLSLKTRHASR